MEKFWRTLRLPPRRLVLWHSVAAVPMGTVVVLGAYLSYHYHALAVQNRDRVDHAYEVLDVVDGLYISIQNADLAQRDFIITGDAGPLATFQASLSQERSASERLRGLFSDSPKQEARLAALDAMVAAKLAELGRTITLRQTRGFEPARDAIRRFDDRGMDAIRAQVAEIGDGERRLLVRRQAAGREQERETLRVGVFIATLSVATRVLIALGLKRMEAKRKAAAAEVSPVSAA